MRTEHSWTELRRGAGDLRALLAFRGAAMTPRARTRLRLGLAAILLLSVAVVVVPAYARDAVEDPHRGELVALMPTLLLAFLVLTTVSSVTSGGGREIVPRDQAVAYPVSTVTEHLGALLLAPLNTAWLIQAWALLGTTAYLLGPRWLGLSVVPVLLWIAVCTAAGQAAGWAFEGIRRSHRHGVALVRVIAALAAAGVALLVITGRFTAVLDSSPTVEIYLGSASAPGGNWTRFGIDAAALLAMLVGAVLLGLLPSRWALTRPQREELRLESGVREARPNPRGDLAAMVRVDRSSIWRAVPIRRGLLVLGVMPGAVALAGDLTWDLVTVLPGLVASGGALLFGVNTWCLEGRGALWRDSLPVDPRIGFAAKAMVLLEVLLVAAALTVGIAALRAGVPTPAQATSIVSATVVVSVYVVARSLRWSVARPYAVDMRSARATPAPPVVMAGYSARLAIVTTLLGLVFSATSYAEDWRVPLLLAVPFLCWSGWRLVRTSRAWADPQTRARVVAVVAT
ncbi:hypothetical protein [Marmoricola sp. RAF53]|uniref:hypothetical protein n=1 Tax=Marmoricola sp. RAF53 TaxID=3233059 RepID=UPI003F96B132